MRMPDARRLVRVGRAHALAGGADAPLARLDSRARSSAG